MGLSVSEIRSEYPSVDWGTDEWVAVLREDDQAATRLFSAIARVSTAWRRAGPGERRTLCHGDRELYEANLRADRLWAVS